MQVKYIARIRLTSWRTAQNKRHLAICDRMLAKIIVDDKRVAGVVSEILAHGAARIWRQILKRSRLASTRRNYDRIIHRAVFFKLFNDLRDGRLFLSDRYIDANDVLTLLIDDGINSNSGFSCLAVADDELALSATDRH